MVNRKLNLEVAGAAVPEHDLYRYALRFVGLAVAVPALYRDGKRVTKPWRAEFDLESEEDQHGGNANTA